MARARTPLTPEEREGIALAVNSAFRSRHRRIDADASRFETRGRLMARDQRDAYRYTMEMKMDRFIGFIRIGIVAIVATAMSGCASGWWLRNEAVATAPEEVANLYVSAYPEVPWNDISSLLEPKHNLTTEQAREMATRTTQVQISQFISTFAAGLGIGLPVHSRSLTTTTGVSGSQTTEIEARGPGTVPASSGQPTKLTATITPDFTKGPSLGLDANTLLTAGTAIFQLAQILDNQISKGFLSTKTYAAHLVTMQVNLQPKRRSLPFDTYVDVSLLPGRWDEAYNVSADTHDYPDGLPPVTVYPLIITDAIETANVGRSLETIRQAALQLSGLIGGAGVSGSAGGGNSRFDSLVGLDKNSLVTVGRVNSHTVRIRLGAANAGSTALALVPRTYNVSLVVLTRLGVKTLSAVTHSSFAKTDSSHTIITSTRRTRKVLATRVAREVFAYGYAPVEEYCPFTPADVERSKLLKGRLLTLSKRDGALVNSNLELLLAVDRGDYQTVARCLNLTESISMREQQRLRRFLAAVVEIQADSRYSTLLIPLKQYEPSLPPAAQLVLYADNKKTSTSFVIRGGKGLDPKRVWAELHLANSSILLPTSLKVVDEGAEINVDFPSLERLGLSASQLANPPLWLTILDDHPCTMITKECQGYRIQAPMAVEEAKAKNPAQSSASVIVADTHHAGRVTLQVGAFPKDSSVVPPLKLLVRGANVANDKSTYSSKGIDITENSTIMLLLDNLTSSSAVTVSTVDSNNEQVGDPIVFAVERGATSK